MSNEFHQFIKIAAFAAFDAKVNALVLENILNKKKLELTEKDLRKIKDKAAKMVNSTYGDQLLVRESK